MWGFPHYKWLLVTPEPYFFLWILILNYVAEWSIWADNPRPQSFHTTRGYRSQRSPHGSGQQQGVKNISQNLCLGHGIIKHFVLRAIATYGLFRVGNLKSLASCCPRTKFWLTRAGEEDLQFKRRRAILDKTCAVQTAIQTSLSRYSLCCQFSPDSSLLVTTSADHTAKLWRTSDFTLVQVVIHLF